MAEKRKLENTSGQVGTTSVEVLPENYSRKYLLIQNKSTTDALYVTFKNDASISNGLRIDPGAAYEPPYEVISRVSLLGAAGVDYVLVTG